MLDNRTKIAMYVGAVLLLIVAWAFAAEAQDQVQVYVEAKFMRYVVTHEHGRLTILPGTVGVILGQHGNYFRVYWTLGVDSNGNGVRGVDDLSVHMTHVQFWGETGN